MFEGQVSASYTGLVHRSMSHQDPDNILMAMEGYQTQCYFPKQGPIKALFLGVGWHLRGVS